LLESFAERDQSVSVTPKEILEVKAPFVIVDAEKITRKDDVRPNSDEIGSGDACYDGVPLYGADFVLVFALHRPKIVRRESHVIPVDHVGMGTT
jgi:hypothetical protein